MNGKRNKIKVANRFENVSMNLATRESVRSRNQNKYNQSDLINRLTKQSNPQSIKASCQINQSNKSIKSTNQSNQQIN